MFSILNVTTVLWLLPLLSHCSSAYELHDTIHSLKEENLHLQHRLENLTQALRDLKLLLTEHSKVSGGEHDTEFLHAWKEWSQLGVSAETRQMLEQALCLTELHGAAQPILITPGFLLLSPLICVTVMMLS
ncbi:uncharacterized protein LOC143321280 isoform X2 [Chaetodon auriga]|uniref:uncharacterized protein LOC143321280 isoform X2 n=1 Tax=Chaetodon auriga TaxID=39042 RepID=UPI00403312E2